MELCASFFVYIIFNERRTTGAASEVVCLCTSTFCPLNLQLERRDRILSLGDISVGAFFPVNVGLRRFDKRTCGQPVA
jgi:hypothetical protein